MDSKVRKVALIIQGATMAAAAVGAGMAQMPVPDASVITPIQAAMIISIGEVHGKRMDKSGALVMLSSASAPILGRTVVKYLIGWFPGVGNAANAATAAVLTEAIGWWANGVLAA